MKKIVTLRQALSDDQYFGAQLAGPSWAPWRALLLAIMGEPLTPDELTLFTSLTERQPGHRHALREDRAQFSRRPAFGLHARLA
jgi:hypothetical protein